MNTQEVFVIVVVGVVKFNLVVIIILSIVLVAKNRVVDGQSNFLDLLLFSVSWSPLPRSLPRPLEVVVPLSLVVGPFVVADPLVIDPLPFFTIVPFDSDESDLLLISPMSVSV